MKLRHYYLYKAAESSSDKSKSNSSGKTYSQEEFDKLIDEYEKSKRRDVARTTGNKEEDFMARVGDRIDEIKRVNYDIRRAKRRSDGFLHMAPAVLFGYGGFKIGDWFRKNLRLNEENGFLPFGRTFGWKNPYIDEFYDTKHKQFKSPALERQLGFTDKLLHGVGIAAQALTTIAGSVLPYTIANNFIEAPKDAVHDTIGFNRPKL